MNKEAGRVREVVARFKKGNPKPTSEATIDSHLGKNVEKCLRPSTNIQREKILYIYTAKLYVLSFF